MDARATGPRMDPAERSVRAPSGYSGAVSTDKVMETMRRLCRAERARRKAIDDLISLKVVRSRRLVADIGEALAARYYDVPLVKNANELGYDLVTRDGSDD